MGVRSCASSTITCPNRCGAAADERVRLVEQGDVAVAPAATAPQEERLLRRIEDPRCRLLERGARGEEPAHELLRLRRRPDLIEEALQPPVLPQRALDVLERPHREGAEPRAVVLVEAAEHVHAKALARGQGEPERGARRGKQLGDLVGLDADERALHADDELAGARLQAELRSTADDLRQARVAFERGGFGGVDAAHDDAVDELADRPLLHALLSERGKDVRDVVHEDRVRPDDEHAAELRAVREEEVGGAMEADSGLAGSGPSLDDERRDGLARDQAVLICLDRGHDVAHPALARAVELLQQEVVDARERVLERAVERLVAQVEEPSALRAKAAAERDAVRVVGCRRVEGPGRRRLPVDDERLGVVVVHPSPPDVDGRARALDVDAAEAEPALRVGE